MKTPTPQATASFPLRPGLTESNLCPALTGLCLDMVWTGRRWVGLELGQHRRCPPALRLARTYAGQQYRSGHARCGYRVRAAVVARLSHSLQPAWIPCTARGPPASPVQLPPPATASSTNPTILSLTGDEISLAGPARLQQGNPCRLITHCRIGSRRSNSLKERERKVSKTDLNGGGTIPPHRGKRRFLRGRTWGVLVAAIVLGTGIAIPAASFADNSSGCDFAATGTTQSCSGPLAGSTFAGGDGNLLASPTTFGSTDWQNVAGLNPGFDLPSGSGDNSFGQGTKEDDPNVSVVSGSIPPNKSDLTRFYEASEFSSVNNHNFLYLGWERTNVLGSANFDFEINQKTQPDLTTAGAKTLVRTAGDLLVTYDFNNGGGRPTIGLMRWLTSTTVPVVPGFATNVCFSSNTFPCWGDQVTLDGTDSIAAVNNLDAVTDPLFPNGPNYINPVPALQFGETAIDLTKAGVFSPGTCTAFGSAFVRSRSSASFTAEIKDFIAPIPVNISNCGQITIIKNTDPRGINQNFSYTSTIPAEPPGTVNGIPQGGVVCPGKSSAGVQTDGSFCLNDVGNTTG